MKNLEAVLQESGVNFFDVVKTIAYITDNSIFRRINTVYLEYMRDPYPARETVVVKSLPIVAEIEINIVAVKK